jgi:hypothetical protein
MILLAVLVILNIVVHSSRAQRSRTSSLPVKARQPAAGNQTGPDTFSVSKAANTDSLKTAGGPASAGENPEWVVLEKLQNLLQQINTIPRPVPEPDLSIELHTGKSDRFRWEIQVSTPAAASTTVAAAAAQAPRDIVILGAFKVKQHRKLLVREDNLVYLIDNSRSGDPDAIEPKLLEATEKTFRIRDSLGTTHDCKLKEYDSEKVRQAMAILQGQSGGHSSYRFMSAETASETSIPSN